MSTFVTTVPLLMLFRTRLLSDRSVIQSRIDFRCRGQSADKGKGCTSNRVRAPKPCISLVFEPYNFRMEGSCKSSGNAVFGATLRRYLAYLDWNATHLSPNSIRQALATSNAHSSCYDGFERHAWE